ncbi:DUF805 domain-containing protein [Leucobacter ruminantium]
MTLPPNPEHPEQPNGGSQQQGDGQQSTPAQSEAPAAPGRPESTQPQQPGYAPQQPPQYGAPQPPQSPQYGAPQQPYGAPQPPQYGAPQAAPQAPQYGGAPQAPSYGAPQYQQRYGAPQFASAYGVEPGPGGPYDGAVNPDDMTRPLYGASFGQAIRRFFKGYAKFSGRASRSEYWWVALFSFLVSLIPSILLVIGFVAVMSSSAYSYSYDYDYSPGASAGAIALLVIGGGLYVLVWLGMLLPTFAIGWRRLHDANFAGPLYLLVLGSMIPFLNYIGWIGSIVVLIFTLMPSKAEGRRFDYS